MPVRIEIGRFGFRGAKNIDPSVSDAIVVDCRVLKDPAYRRKGQGPRLSLEQIKTQLLEDQHSKTQELVQAVIDGVLEGKVVCVKCLMGRNRSQAVASIACEELAKSYPDRVYEGPVYLGGIKKTD